VVCLGTSVLRHTTYSDLLKQPDKHELVRSSFAALAALNQHSFLEVFHIAQYERNGHSGAVPAKGVEASFRVGGSGFWG
jgi:hypothetical protein